VKNKNPLPYVLSKSNLLFSYDKKDRRRGVEKLTKKYYYKKGFLKIM